VLTNSFPRHRDVESNKDLLDAFAAVGACESMAGACRQIELHRAVCVVAAVAVEEFRAGFDGDIPIRGRLQPKVRTAVISRAAARPNATAMTSFRTSPICGVKEEPHVANIAKPATTATTWVRVEVISLTFWAVVPFRQKGLS
jgi:hypothetical protein